MGSIQIFPRRRALRAAPAWPDAQVASRAPVRVRPARLGDFATIHALHRACAVAGAGPGVRCLEARRQAFPAGQLVAEVRGQVVGAASSLMVDWERHAARARWATLTGQGAFSSHDPEGLALFAAETVVDPGLRGRGVGRALYQARRQLCRRLNLRHILAACPMPGYAAVGPTLPPERYAMRLVMGDIPDPLLRFHLALGFQFCGVLHDFHEKGDAGHALLLAWSNPAFDPPRPPAAEKCA